MNEYQRGAEVLEREITRIEDLIALKSVLAEAGSLKQAVDEYTSRSAELTAKNAAAEADLKNTLRETVEAKAAAETAVADINQRVEHILAAARADAEGILSKAQSDAAAIAAKAEKNRKAANDEVAEVRRIGAAAEAEADAAQARLDDINRQIAEVRKKVG